MQRIILKKIQEGYAFNTSAYIRAGFQNFISNMHLYVPYIIAVSIFSSLLTMLPLGAFLVSLVVSPLAAAGLYIVIEKRFRGERAVAADFLGGTPHLGALILTTFLQALAIVAAVLLLTILLSFPAVSLLKNIDFSLGFVASGAVYPVLALCLFVGLVLTLVTTWYVFAYQYVIFGKMEGQEAMHMSRKVVSKQLTNFFILFFIIGLIFALFSIAVLYFSNQHLLFMEMIEAIKENDQERLRFLGKNTDITTQLLTSVASGLLTPIVACITQAAFRDIHEIDKTSHDKDNTLDNTIDHLIG
jgi:hypothetical protein